MRYLYCIAVVLLFCASAFAISSQEALSFVQSGQWMYANEQPEIFSSAPISYGNAQYWVVALLQGNTVSGYLAVLNRTPPQLLSKKAANTQLFRAGAFLRGYLNLRDGAVRQSQWIFSSSQSGYFNNLKQLLQNEIDGDLAIIANDSNSLEIRSQAVSMQQDLKDVQDLSAQAGQSIDDALKAENDFLSTPSAEEVDDFHAKLESTQSILDSLEEKAISYDGKKTQLKSLLAKASLDASQKSYLISLAEPPQPFYQLFQGSSSKKSIGLTNTQALNTLLDAAQAAASNAADAVDLRVQRASAYNSLYGDNNSLRSKTESVYSSLKQFSDDALSDGKKDLWVNQSELQSFQDNYSKAVAAYNQNKFSEAISFAGKAVINAGNVYRDGFESAEELAPDVTLFLYGAGILAVLLVGVYVLQNKDKLFKKGEEGEGDEKGYRLD